MTILQRYLDRLRDQTAWITGGKRIGRNVARALAEQGVNIVVSYRNSRTEAEETAEEMRSLGVKALALHADVSCRESAQNAAERIQAEYGSLNILVNMASVYYRTPIESITEADWEQNIGAHILGTFWPVRYSVGIMPPGSHIINVADITAIGKSYRSHLPYIATKAAVVSMTQTMALEYGAAGIFVNAIAPGPIVPPPDFPTDAWKRIRESTRLKYPMTDEEAIEQFSVLVLYLSLVTMASGVTYPLDQAQNL